MVIYLKVLTTNIETPYLLNSEKVMLEAKNKKTLIRLSGVILLMGMLVVVSVPLYDWFCRVTGYGGTTSIASENNQEIVSESINIRFDASLASGMPWDFNPEVNEVTVNLGESKTVNYIAHNPTDQPITGTATFNVFPFTAGEYFVKLQCFCFMEQTLQPGESKEMPVVFFVEPEITEGEETKNLEAITLSYTFHRMEETG